MEITDIRHDWPEKAGFTLVRPTGIEIYTFLHFMNSVEIVNDIRMACLSDNKMTEKERMEIVFGIRPKLKMMNKKLQRLTKAVKYTTMGDIWREIDEGARPVAGKRDIVEAAKRRWRQIGRNVRP